MPYHLVKEGKKFEVKNMDTGKGHGKTTKTKAESQMRLLRGLEQGFIPHLLPKKPKT